MTQFGPLSVQSREPRDARSTSQSPVTILYPPTLLTPKQASDRATAMAARARGSVRGDDERSDFQLCASGTRIAADHPLRSIRELVDRALLELSPAFDRVYAREGRPSIPPERLLRALLLQAFYTVRWNGN
jgi:hypothetical protein